MGYTGGARPNPTYSSVCSGDGHTEALKIDFDPNEVSYDQLLDVFWDNHNPTVPLVTQYKSAIWPQTADQERAALESAKRFEESRGRAVATDIARVDGTAAPEWHDAEWYHQNYNAKNKVRLGGMALLFLLNYMPEGSFPGQAVFKAVLGGAVFASLLPQLVPGFDKFLDIFD